MKPFIVPEIQTSLKVTGARDSSIGHMSLFITDLYTVS